MSFSIYQLAALMTAFSWAVGSLVAQVTVRELGTFAFNRFRLLIATAMLFVCVFFFGDWESYPFDAVPYVLISGFVGIFLGDAILFACFARLGARRGSVLYATNAPMTVILGFLFLNEQLTFIEILGILITILGVILAIVYGKRRTQINQWEEVRGILWVGVLLGLLGALGQAVGSIIMRPVMSAGADPLTSAFLRVAIAAAAFLFFHLIMKPIRPNLTNAHNPLTPKLTLYLCIQAFTGMLLGMTLLMFALSGPNVNTGVIATLSATTPVMILPALWWVTKEFPAIGAWVGAIICVAGTALIAAGG